MSKEPRLSSLTVSELEILAEASERKAKEYRDELNMRFVWSHGAVAPATPDKVEIPKITVDKGEPLKKRKHAKHISGIRKHVQEYLLTLPVGQVYTNLQLYEGYRAAKPNLVPETLTAFSKTLRLFLPANSSKAGVLSLLVNVGFSLYKRQDT